MTAKPVLTDEAAFELLISGLIDHQFATLPEHLPKALSEGLRKRLIDCRDKQLMVAAGTGREAQYKQQIAVRGDLISWLDNESVDPFEQAFFLRIAAFAAYLNRTCYAGIDGWEFHYALYEPGSFYKRHRDQFKHMQSRKFSIVHYLQENWQDEDGGQLAIYTEDGVHLINPEEGRVVFFRSDETDHEVLLSHTSRMSITGWLKG
jgi:SM-20-related protein